MQWRYYMSKVVDGPYKLGVAMATVRGKAAVKVAVGIAADRALTRWEWRWRQ
jgi:hypothetical protein